MEQKLDNKIPVKETIISFFDKNKLKIVFSIIIILISTITLIIIKESKKRENILISEKYIKAGLLLSKNENEKAKNYYEEIVLGENKFYSLLALNTLIEKDLINDKEKITNYFAKLENSNFSKDLTDLILIKKALYLIKIKDDKLGQNILKKLVEGGSNLKFLAQDLIN